MHNDYVFYTNHLRFRWKSIVYDGDPFLVSYDISDTDSIKRATEKSYFGVSVAGSHSVLSRIFLYE